MKNPKPLEPSPGDSAELPVGKSAHSRYSKLKLITFGQGMCCHFYRSPYLFQDAFVNAIQDDFKYTPKLLHLTGNSAMNASLYESQIILKYRRDKEVFFYTLI